MGGPPRAAMRLIACAIVWLVAAAPAVAKPTVCIAVRFAKGDKPARPGEKTLYARIHDDLVRADVPIPDPEDFVARQLARAFSVLEMFDFKVCLGGPGALVHDIEVASNGVAVWPGSDAILTVRSKIATLTGIVFARRALCGSPHCYPDTRNGFADPAVYLTLVGAVIDQWKPELQRIFASVVIDPEASYRDGRVISIRPIEELGEVSGR